MAYNFSSLQKKIEEIKEWLSGEYSGIRTGRATPALLDTIRIDVYGSRMPLNQVGSVTVEDARSLRVNPWDMNQIKAIEKAINDAGLGVNAGSDEKGVRVTFPELTSERREQLMKLVRAKLEEARVSLRKAREEVWNDLQKKEKDGELSEDDKFRGKEDMQKHIDRGNAELDELAKKKEQELAS